MPKWWRVCAAGLVVVTAVAFGVHLSMREGGVGSSVVEAAASELPENELTWRWEPAELEPAGGCAKFENCVFVQVEDTARCGLRLQVDMYLTDAHDNYVAYADSVIVSPQVAEPVVIELGVDRDDFEYFAVSSISCTASAPNGVGGV